MSHTIRPETRAILERLIAFDTTSRNSNLALLDYVAEYLAGFGVKAELVFNDERTKANLFATIGPTEAGGIALSGHTDVVPVDDQAWSSDPWTLREADGRLYGRGTSDMKTFSALALAFVPDFLAARPRRPLHLVLSHDEEVGCVGVRSLIAQLGQHLPKPALCIVGEPTDMQVVNAHKGIRSFRTEVLGREAHSSQTDKGVNAVMIAAELIMKLKSLADEMIARGDPTGRFDPPYTTVQCATISGGTALNILARRCSFQWEYRHLPGTDADDIHRRFEAFVDSEMRPRIQSVAPEADIITQVRSRVPPLIPETDSPAETLAKHLATQNDAAAVSYGTEAGLFQEVGIPTIICGPGSILQAHKPDEWISLEQVALGEAFMARLCRYLSSADGA
ncbi:MAG TPA: acetylornithine deacetylase [Alphaproteobacteria bacterium]|nr:acetylornithine deacetylase [Alphaproteobacteria bacterium]HAJ48016.1 acetylornithine deacetylase [Alphaproteobacteria bacterium]